MTVPKWSVASLLCLFLVFVALPVFALQFRTGQTITISRGEVIEEDLYLAGNTVVVDGTVHGDVWVAARNCIINGDVKGNVLGGAETMTIGGTVERTVRVAGRTINVHGTVGGDLLAFAGEVHVAESAKVEKCFVFGAGSTQIAGIVHGPIWGGGGEIVMSSPTKGDVKLKVDQLTLMSTASLGNLTYTSGNKAVIESGAQITGEVVHNVPEAEEVCAMPVSMSMFSGVKSKILGFAMILLIGFVCILIAPRWLTFMAQSMTLSPGPSLGWGLVILLVVPFAAVIACITIIGLPLGAISLVWYAIAIYLAQIPVALCVGLLITRRLDSVQSKGFMFLALALGLIIVRFLRLLPWVGWLVTLLVVLLGFGAVLESHRRKRAQAEGIIIGS